MTVAAVLALAALAALPSLTDTAQLWAVSAAFLVLLAAAALHSG